MNIKNMVLEDLERMAAFIVLYTVIFLLGKWLKDVLTPYKLNDELVKSDNLAVSISMSGYFLAIAIIFMGALFGPSQGFVDDLILVGGYSILGLVFLNLARWVSDKIILRKFCSTELLTKEQNLGVGAVNFGISVATALIAAGAISGQGGGVVSSIVFFILGQLSLFLFSFVYAWFVPYNIHEELEKKNTAAGVAFGGTLIALSIIVMNGSSGNFSDWRNDLTLFGVVNLTAFIFLPIIRFTMDRLVVTGVNLSHEIRDDRNIGAGLLEAIIAISFATILVQLI